MDVSRPQTAVRSPTGSPGDSQGFSQRKQLPVGLGPLRAKGSPLSKSPVTSSLQDWDPHVHASSWLTDDPLHDSSSDSPMPRAWRNSTAEDLQRELIVERSARAQLEQDVATRDRQAAQMQQKLRDLESALESERESIRSERASVFDKQNRLDADVSRGMQAVQALLDTCNVLANRLSFQLTDKQAAAVEGQPPFGEVAVVNVDIDGANEKWNLNAPLMHEVMTMFTRLVRDKTREHHGYEVKSDSDAFTIAFGSSFDAAYFALDLQTTLLKYPWPPGVLSWPGCEEETDDKGRVIWRGVRARIGASLGPCTCDLDANTGRMHYSGQVVNRALRLSQLAAGGQILINAGLWDRVSDVMSKAHCVDLGLFTLRGVSEKTQVKLLLPQALSSRKFPPPVATYLGNGMDEKMLELARKANALRDTFQALSQQVDTVTTAALESDRKLKLQGPLSRSRSPTRSPGSKDAEDTTAADQLLERILAERQALTQRLEQMQTAVETNKATVEQMQAQLDELTQEKSELQSSLLQRIAVLEACGPAAGGAVSNQLGLTPELQMEMQSLREERAAAQKLVAQHESALLTLQAELVEMQVRERDEIRDLSSKVKRYEEQLRETVTKNQAIERQLNAQMNRLAFKTADNRLAPPPVKSPVPGPSDGADASQPPPPQVAAPPLRLVKEVEPPIGHVCLIFTDIEDSTAKWESNAEVMASCLTLHNTVMRRLIAQFDGYEVKTEGDAFMIAFGSTLNAALFFAELQCSLLSIDWPEECYSLWPDCAVQRNASGDILWRGIRVRAAAHVGLPSCHVDPVNGRMDYFGKIVNRTSRIVSLAAGGQTLISGDIWEEIKTSIPNHIDVKDLGPMTLKGVPDQTQILQVSHVSLAARDFPRGQSSQVSNSIEENLRSLIQENNQLKKHLAEVEDELRQIMSFSTSLEKRLSPLQAVRPPQRPRGFKELFSMKNLLERASWNAELSEQVTHFSTKLTTLREETNQIRGHIADLIKQKRLLMDERDLLLRRIHQLEAQLAAVCPPNTVPSSPMSASLDALSSGGLQSVSATPREAPLLPVATTPHGSSSSGNGGPLSPRRLDKLVRKSINILKARRNSHSEPPPEPTTPPPQAQSPQAERLFREVEKEREMKAMKKSVSEELLRFFKTGKGSAILQSDTPISQSAVVGHAERPLRLSGQAQVTAITVSGPGGIETTPLRAQSALARDRSATPPPSSSSSASSSVAVKNNMMLSVQKIAPTDRPSSSSEKSHRKRRSLDLETDTASEKEVTLSQALQMAPPPRPRSASSPQAPLSSRSPRPTTSSDQRVTLPSAGKSQLLPKTEKKGFFS